MPALTSIALVAGVGLSAASMFGGSDTARKQAAEQKAIAADQQKIEAQKMQAMELDAKRRQLEVFRNVQRAKSMALVNATGQGAGQGSGLAGGYGQVAGEAENNLLGVKQALETGRNIFDINADMSQHKMALADLGADASFYSGLGSLGGTLLGATGSIGKLTSGWGK